MTAKQTIEETPLKLTLEVRRQNVLAHRLANLRHRPETATCPHDYAKHRHIIVKSSLGSAPLRWQLTSSANVSIT